MLFLQNNTLYFPVISLQLIYFVNWSMIIQKIAFWPWISQNNFWKIAEYPIFFWKFTGTCYSENRPSDLIGFMVESCVPIESLYCQNNCKGRTQQMTFRKKIAHLLHIFLIEEIISHPDFTNNNMDYYILVVCTKAVRIF